MHPPGPDAGDDYEARKAKMDREYIRACKAAGIEPDVSCRTSSQNFAGDGSTVARGFEGDKTVPMTLPPTEANPLTDAQVLLKIIGHACGWANGHPGKWQAFLVAADYDIRTTAEIAESLKISQRSFQGHVKAAREWFAELRAEMEGKAVPAKGDQP
jgi:hypothetical protein